MSTIRYTCGCEYSGAIGSASCPGHPSHPRVDMVGGLMTETPRPDPWADIEAREGWYGDEENVVYPADAVDAARAADAAEIDALKRRLSTLEADYARVQGERDELWGSRFLDQNATRLALERAEAAEARCATLTAALEQALPFVADTYRRGGRVGLLNAGDVIEQIDAALAAAPQGDKACS